MKNCVWLWPGRAIRRCTTVMSLSCEESVWGKEAFSKQARGYAVLPERVVNGEWAASVAIMSANLDAICVGVLMLG